MMSLSDEQWEFLQDFGKLIKWCADSGYKITAGELYRTLDQQQIYVDKGLSWTLDSYHMKRLAADVNLFVDGVYVGDLSHQEQEVAYKPLGDYWEYLNPKNKWGVGGTTGAPDKDFNHFERRV